MKISGKQSRRGGFSLVELLVVIGIIAVLIAILLPQLTRARASAESVKCKANLRQIGTFLLLYSEANRGFLYPVGGIDGSGQYTTLGAQLPPHLRWPVYAFPKMTVPTDPSLPEYSDPARWRPEIMVCPGDFEPGAGHSYLLNKHLIENPQQRIKYSSRIPDGRSPSDVVVIGEKKTLAEDYYMEGPPRLPDGTYDPNDDGEFGRVVEQYRHGKKLGSNYLRLDWSVDIAPPNAIKGALDPWQVVKTTQPVGP
jgi:prepilin-type N-terminal cleavage/methylation domain-containing protein